MRALRNLRVRLLTETIPTRECAEIWRPWQPVRVEPFGLMTLDRASEAEELNCPLDAEQSLSGQACDKPAGRATRTTPGNEN